MTIFRPVSRITQCIFLIGAHSFAQAAIINFSGQLDTVEADSGGAVYSGVAIGTIFSGAIDDVTFDGSITDGTTLTAFGCCIAAGGLSVSNNEPLDAGGAALLNSLGNTNFVAGDLIDLIDIEGDAITSGGGRIEIGLSYVLDPLAFNDNSLDNYPPNPDDILISLFFIAEFDGQEEEIYSALGALDVLDTDSDGDGVPDDEDAFPNDPTETTDTDGDGIGNNADPDDDNDGVPDGQDDFPLGRFDDARPDYWAFTFIEALARAGITAGCGGSNYCPLDPVTRAQMAVFLERGMNGSNFSPPAATGNTFLDVGAGDFAASFIEQLFLDGITAGCGNNNYCPNTTVTRDQMAVFLLRAKHGAGYSPPPATGIFGDVDLSYWAVHWIEQLAAEGITAGCGGGNYCPEAPVTRDQMAVFLVRTFGL